MRGKKILITIALILGIILVGACSSPTTTTPPTTSAPATTTTAPPTTTVAPKPTTAAPSPTVAEVFPNKPIEFIVPYAAGGGTDRNARLLAGYSGEYLGAQLRVICMSGGGGTEGSLYVAKAKPDGYTLNFHTMGSALLPPLIRDVGYTVESYDPVAQITTNINALVIYPDHPLAAKAGTVDGVKEFFAYAKANPGKLSYGSAGTGSSPHFGMELLQLELGLPTGTVKHVPFDGSAESITAVMGKHIDTAWTSLSSIIPQVKAGKLKVLYVTSKERMSAIDAPTLIESGINFDFGVWVGVFAPKGTPADRLNTLEAGFKKIVQDKNFINLFVKVQGEDPSFASRADFTNVIKNSLPKFLTVAKTMKQ